MCLCVHVCVYFVCVCVCMYIFACMCTCVCVCVCLFVYICLCVCMCICMCVFMCVFVFVCVYLYVYIYLCVCVSCPFDGSATLLPACGVGGGVTHTLTLSDRSLVSHYLLCVSGPARTEITPTGHDLSLLHVACCTQYDSYQHLH